MTHAYTTPSAHRLPQCGTRGKAGSKRARAPIFDSSFSRLPSRGSTAAPTPTPAPTPPGGVGVGLRPAASGVGDLASACGAVMGWNDAEESMTERARVPVVERCRVAGRRASQRAASEVKSGERKQNSVDFNF